MNPTAHAAYIVGCIREAASMYPQDAEQFLAEHDAHRRAEVLAEAADKATEIAKAMQSADESWASRAGWACASVAAELKRMATAGKGTSDGSQPPAGESTQAAPDFFQPGHGYTRRDGTTFQCITVTPTPWNGRPLAIGWHTDAADITSISWRGIGEWLHEYDGCEPPTGGETA